MPAGFGKFIQICNKPRSCSVFLLAIQPETPPATENGLKLESIVGSNANNDQSVTVKSYRSVSASIS
jgi:hypothetical protein